MRRLVRPRSGASGPAVRMHGVGYEDTDCRPPYGDLEVPTDDHSVAEALVRSATSRVSKQSPAPGFLADAEDVRALADALLLSARSGDGHGASASREDDGVSRCRPAGLGPFRDGSEVHSLRIVMLLMPPSLTAWLLRSTSCRRCSGRLSSRISASSGRIAPTGRGGRCMTRRRCSACCSTRSRGPVTQSGRPAPPSAWTGLWHQGTTVSSPSGIKFPTRATSQRQQTLLRGGPMGSGGGLIGAVVGGSITAGASVVSQGIQLKRQFRTPMG